MFAPDVLGSPVPFWTEPAGRLAQEGTGARLRPEAVSSPESAVVAVSGLAGRSFQLDLNQDLVHELCRTPTCPRRMVI
ncbi:hypothetical protein [Streptomyces clavuligerus]|uniref:hypothetical protein n=1 Tax=Streptomyces clavuligerus TaxID=1901 RepID=UPI000185195F|nr:hypothetical protein [Streptomyces clavuligerus]WDN56465.1 hypothetical protein LL058_32005 [Streptomyces clavuligerus]